MYEELKEEFNSSPIPDFSSIFDDKEKIIKNIIEYKCDINKQIEDTL